MNDNFDMKAFDEGGYDQLLRETMAGHRVEPKPGLWKSISRKLLWKELLHFNFTNLSPKMWMAGSAGILLIFTTIYVGVNPGPSETTSKKTSVEFSRVALDTRQPVASHSPGMLDNTVRNTAEKSTGANQPVLTSLNMKSIKSSHETPGAPASLKSYIPAKSEGKLSAEPNILSEDPELKTTNTSTDIAFEVPSGITRMYPLQANLTAEFPLTDSIITISNAAGILKFRKDSPGNAQFFSANVGIMPEVAFYQEPDGYAKTNFWLNGGVTYHISRFSIGTGFGLGYVYDEGKYKVDYKSLDSVGYFTGVNSFSLGTNNEIIYNTQTIGVYDSLQHVGDYRTQNRYSYLQIPLLFGYRFFESNRISMTFQAGPAFSVLLGSRKSEPVIEYSNATIIRVDDDTPVRVNTNWQVWTNLYLEMRVNKQVSIFVEPSFKYYLKPMVTQENVKFKEPWTIGLGVGLQFNFGQKKKSP